MQSLRSCPSSSVSANDSILAIGGHEKELYAHTRGALRNGLTEENIREAMLHVLGYGGFPKGLEAYVCDGSTSDGADNASFRVCESAIDDYKKEVEEEGKAA